MRGLPKLADTTLQSTLEAHYGLPHTTLTFLPIGNDAASFVYRVDTDDRQSYFLKVRASDWFRAPSIVLPRFLFEQGVPHIITPLPTLERELWVHEGDFYISLYPFIDARTATATGLSRQQWHALGATLNQIHTYQLPDHLRQIMPQETFVPSRRQVLTNLQATLANSQPSDPLQRELAAFWWAREDELRALIERADTLGSQLRQSRLPRVVCHADLHTWNVLVDTERQMWIVDWDETILAPKERDLMFSIGGIARGLVKPAETSRFLQGYGDAKIDQRALAYYRYAWTLQEMAAYAEEVFFLLELGEQVRSDALRSFIDVFEPGNIAALAREADNGAL
jgi:spectinomycin phosphotransferase